MWIVHPTKEPFRVDEIEQHWWKRKTIFYDRTTLKSPVKKPTECGEIKCAEGEKKILGVHGWETMETNDRGTKKTCLPDRSINLQKGKQGTPRFAFYLCSCCCCCCNRNVCLHYKACDLGREFGQRREAWVFSHSFSFTTTTIPSIHWLLFPHVRFGPRRYCTNKSKITERMRCKCCRYIHQNWFLFIVHGSAECLSNGNQNNNNNNNDSTTQR